MITVSEISTLTKQQGQDWRTKRKGGGQRESKGGGEIITTKREERRDQENQGDEKINGEFEKRGFQWRERIAKTRDPYAASV